MSRMKQRQSPKTDTIITGKPVKKIKKPTKKKPKRYGEGGVRASNKSNSNYG